MKTAYLIAWICPRDRRVTGLGVYSERVPSRTSRDGRPLPVSAVLWKVSVNSDDFDLAHSQLLEVVEKVYPDFYPELKAEYDRSRALRGQTFEVTRT